jgi:hypothetical protein
MSNKSNSTKTPEVIDRAGLAVETASMDGGMTEVDLEARYLLDENPDRQTSFDELQDAMIRWGMARVGVEFGQRSAISPE